ncbi:hypothetical protein GIB67_006207, partial [Kingdonia uniflora]
MVALCKALVSLRQNVDTINMAKLASVSNAPCQAAPLYRFHLGSASRFSSNLQPFDIDLSSEESRRRTFNSVDQLNDEQRYTYNAVIDSVRNEVGTVFFLNEAAGTGKTFVYNSLAATCRNGKKIAILVTSSEVFTEQDFNLATKEAFPTKLEGLVKEFSFPGAISLRCLDFSLIVAGSKGKTLEELHYLLDSNSNDKLNLFSSQVVSLVFLDASQRGGPWVAFSNGVWIEKSMPMKSSFKGIVENDYKSAAKEVDFITKESATLYEKAVFEVVSYLISSDKDDDVTFDLHSK